MALKSVTATVSRAERKVDAINEVFVLQYGCRGIMLRIDRDEEPTNLPAHAAVLSRTVHAMVRALRVAQEHPDELCCKEDAARALVGIECLSGLAAEIAERIDA